MDKPEHKLCTTGNFGKALIAVSALMTSAVTADVAESTFVDSVHKWGAWELDIEPAAGGLNQSSTQPLNARSSKVTLRTNSISALAPQPAPQITNPPAPIAPPLPTMPTIPSITPINPSVPIPTGGPGFSGAPTIPSITPISPGVAIPTGSPAIPGGSPS